MTVIAIDGPAGAGKSTIARRVAERLHRRYVDTGAMYRAVALAATQRGIDPKDADAVADVARSVHIVVSDGRVLLDDEDVTDAIRQDGVTKVVSIVSAHPQVRAALVPIQRSTAAGFDIVMEGRDIGSEVFPDAETKVWLTASSSERARRRLEQLGRPTSETDIASMERLLLDRDERDASRSASPMKRPADAVEIDTTDKGIAQITDEIVALVMERDRDG